MASRLADLIDQPADLEELKVFIVSWNMGNAEPDGLMNVFDEKNARDSYDIFVIGLQKSTYTYEGMARSYNPGTHESIHHFQNYIRSQFPDAQYEVVAQCYRAQLQLYVIAKKKYRGRISNIETCIENTGFLHVFPNKGGLLVSFHLDGTRLAFVSCHLTAREGIEHCKQRNASIIEILAGVRAGDKDIDITEQFHHIFWMGDMNYRLTFDPRTPANSKKNIEIHNNQHRQVSIRPQQVEKITVELNDSTKSRPGLDGKKVGADSDDSSEGEDAEVEGEKKIEWEANRQKVLDLIVREQWKELMQYDELNREIDSKRVLNGFIALQPSFPPTFKRTRGESIKQVFGPTSPSARWELRRSSVNDYDNVSVKTYYHQKHIPSYTDRILFKSLSTFSDDCRVLFFESCETVISSDHKPVRAGFQIKVTKGSQDILVDQQLLGKSKNPAESRTKEPKHLRLQVFDICGIELEEMNSQVFGGSGSSNPYIVITTDPPDLLLYKSCIYRNVPGLIGDVIKHTVNPVWEMPLFLKLASVDLEGLARNASFIFQVWHENVSHRDELIGCVTIPFRDVLMSLLVDRRPFAFEKFIRKNSELMGQLSGRILLDGDAIGTEENARFIAKERENPTNPTIIPLSQALLEALPVTADSTNCCTIHQRKKVLDW